jgi:hypothetical protein
MPANTSIVSSAEGPSPQEQKERPITEEFEDPGVSAAYNPNLAETREVVLRYINEFDVRDPGGGSRTTRRQETSPRDAWK